MCKRLAILHDVRVVEKSSSCTLKAMSQNSPLLLREGLLGYTTPLDWVRTFFPFSLSLMGDELGEFELPFPFTAFFLDIIRIIIPRVNERRVIYKARSMQQPGYFSRCVAYVLASVNELFGNKRAHDFGFASNNECARCTCFCGPKMCKEKTSQPPKCTCADAPSV